MTRNLFKNRSLLIATFSLAFCMLLFGNLFFLMTNTRKAGAVDSDNTVLTVSKVERMVSFADTDLSDGYTYTSDEPVLLNTASNEDFIMLNNYQTDDVFINETPVVNMPYQNIEVSFGNSGSYVTWLQVTGLLNGQAIDTYDTIKSESLEGGETIYSFNQFLDSKYLKDINGLAFESAEGYYEYTFVYHFMDALGNTSERLTKTFNFWLLDESTYVNPDDNTDVIPKMYNTEKLARDKFDPQIEENYFNYNNFNMTDIYPAVLGSDLAFPTLIFDASKYNVAYAKYLYEGSSIVTSSFEIIAPDQGQISFYKDNEATPFKTDIINATNGNYIYDKLSFEEIGDYDFTFSYLYKIDDANFITANTAEVYEASNRDNDIKLYNFGYQMYYSKNNTSDAEFKDTQSGIITDYTNTQQSFKENYDYINYPNDGSITIPAEYTIASTNQAPVFLKSYASLKYNTTFTTSHSYYHYYPTGVKTGQPIVSSYTNNTRFTQNGYYEVVIIYDFQNYAIDLGGVITSASTTDHMQIFAFKIANLPPTVTIETESGDKITSGNFTNENYVEATWEVGGVFDVQPHAKLWRQAFDGYNPYTQSQLFNGAYDNVNGQDYQQGIEESKISQNGHYTLRVYYGPSNNTSVVYRFTIDKSLITNFTVTGVQESFDEFDNVIYLKNDNVDLTGNKIVNTPFTLQWDEKASGASINAKYSFTSIALKNSFTPTLLTEGSEEWITNGYETLNTFSNLTYYKTDDPLSVQLNANSVLKEASIYVFDLMDQAGNTYNYYLVLDNTKAQILQSPEAVSKYNYIPTQTTITWGTHKAIEVSETSNLPSFITDDTSLFNVSNGTTYLTVPIELVKLYSATLDNADALKGNDIEDQLIRTYIKDLNFKSYVTFYTGLEPDIPAGNEDVTGENIYNAYVTDSSSIDNQTNLNFENEQMLDVKLNLDRSQGYAETYGTVKGTYDNNLRLLEFNQASNRQFLYFNFKEGVDEYVIESLNYDFYPLNFDLASPNYPFASTASLTDMDLLENATFANDMYTTEAINTIYSTKYTKQVTMPGMYVITRTYTGNINESQTGDTKVKQYTYYIDRYDIIEQLDGMLVGDEIELLLGKIVGREAVVFDNFLIQTTKETIVETNLLPVAIKIPENKYSIYNDIDGTYSGGIKSLDLVVTVEREYRDIYGGYSREPVEILGIVNGLIIIPELYQNGIYDVVITDKTGYDNNFTGSNSFSFSFEIKNDKPHGEFYSIANNGQEVSLANVNSTNKHDLKLTWEDPMDIYSAKIDTSNLTITQTLKGSSSPTVIYKLVNGVETVDLYNLSITETIIGKVIGSEEDRKSYEIQIFTEGSDLSLEEAEYVAHIQYEGLEGHYIYDNENFFENSLSIYVDHTAPEFNLNSLISADNYLTSNEKSQVKYDTSAINTENYAFAIDSSYMFIEADITNSKQDTNVIYYRKYDKYTNGEQNLQSLIPSHPDYDNYVVQPIRPRFTTANPEYKAFNYNFSSFASIVANISGGNEYYEIIEIDEAGNYAIYTVQVIFYNPTINGNKINEGPSGEPVSEGASISGTDNEQTDAIAFEFTSIDTKDEWYTLAIEDKSGTTTILDHTPSINESDFINQINTLITPSPENALIGASYEITLSSRVKEDVNFIFNAQGASLEPVFIDDENSFTIILPEETASTTIESFKVYKANNGTVDFTSKYEILIDREGRTIDNSGISLDLYEFDAGEYHFAFVDNFGRKYTIPKIFGLQDIATIFYDGPTATLDNKIYTANDVRIVYQSELYSVEVFKNGETLTIDNADITTDDQTGIVEILLDGIAAQANINDNYSVILTNASGNDTTYNFTVYTVVPNLTLTDSLGADINHIIGFSTTKPVYISYSDNSIFPYVANLARMYTDEFDNNLIETIDNINPEIGYSSVGKYVLTFSNILGINEQYEWDIQETETIIYSVVADVNGVNKILTPSNVRYSFGDEELELYFTIYDYRIDKNPDRNLLVEEIENLTDPNTDIWSIQGDYNKTIAVTTVTPNSNFIASSLEINDVIRGGSSYKTVTNPTVVSWSEFNEFSGNYVYVDYYYNGTYVSRELTDSLTLTDPGVYNLQFTDFAGNVQLFNYSPSYEILVLDEVLFSINDLTPVEDIIYNEPVSLKVEHLQEYDYRSLSISTTLNGKDYTPLKVNDYYIFDGYGVFEVTLSALVTLPNEIEPQEILANYMFTISNPNEAKLAFDYSPQAGYEILSVIKDGIDVTESFKSAYNSNTLTRLFLSPEEGGNGHYEVTVKANYSSLKPSQTFAFNVWINNETPVILNSINEGATTTKNIILTFNKYLIYQQLGECTLKLNNKDTVIINEETSTVNEVTNLQLTENQTYLVQLETSSGNTVLSFKVIKKAPLNSVAIFLIIALVLIIATLTIIFIRLRTKMRVS